jgi:hypothetical protein
MTGGGEAAAAAAAAAAAESEVREGREVETEERSYSRMKPPTSLCTFSWFRY